MRLKCERGCRNKTFKRPQDRNRHYTMQHGGSGSPGPGKMEKMAMSGYSATIESLQERYDAIGEAIKAMKRVEDLED